MEHEISCDLTDEQVKHGTTHVCSSPVIASRPQSRRRDFFMLKTLKFSHMPLFMYAMGIFSNFSRVYISISANLENLREGDSLMTYQSQLYTDFDMLPYNQRDILERALLSDETWKMTVTLSGSVNPPHLTVTDRRLIETENSATGYDSESFQLSDVSQFDYSEGLVQTSISISGSGGIDEEFEVSKLTSTDMDEFQQAVYEYE